MNAFYFALRADGGLPLLLYAFILIHVDTSLSLKCQPISCLHSSHELVVSTSAAAAVLAELHGSDEFRFVTTSDGLPGVTRRFRRFSDAAREAGMSRIYGGIHFPSANEAGWNQVRKSEYLSRANYFKRSLVSRLQKGRLSEESFWEQIAID